MRIFFKKGPLCFSVLSALLLVCLEIESWALALSFVLLFFRFGAEKKWWRPLSTFWVNILSIVGLVLVWTQFRTLLGQEASSTLLVLLSSLRISDFRNERDEKFLILIGFILVALKFLFNMDALWFPIGGLVFLSLWRSLLPNEPDEMESPWKLTLSVALKSLPIVIILFFVFPRVQVPWARNLGPKIPLSGMSDSISPGDIADLTLNQETAFRAKFSSFKPVMRDLYWRGAVLEKMDNFRWNKTDEGILEVEATKDEIESDYTIILEPTDLRILPSFENTRIVSSPRINAYKTDRSTFRTREAISSRIQYSGIFAKEWNGKTISDPFQLTTLPPKTKAWVNDIKSKNLDHIGKVQALKKFFTENNFAYTRSPGSYNDLDEFLFDRRIGFCEHFAGAYATLARALGIPARVITGYQGGEWNNAGDFFRVTQADAHAWAEIRHPKGTWLRVDPTFWIAPLRIELGGLSYFQLSPSDLRRGFNYALKKLQGKNWASQFISNLQYNMDKFNYLWSRTLLDFDTKEQQKILRMIVPKIGWWMTSFILLFILFLFLKRIPIFKASNQEQAIETFLWIESQYQKLGLFKEANEAPIVFLEKVKGKMMRDDVLINKTIQLYRYERYRERKSGPDDWSRLKRAWKKRFSEASKNKSAA